MLSPSTRYWRKGFGFQFQSFVFLVRWALLPPLKMNKGKRDWLKTARRNGSELRVSGRNTEETDPAALLTDSAILFCSDALTQPGGLQPLAEGIARRRLVRAFRRHARIVARVAWVMTKERRIQKSANWTDQDLDLSCFVLFL